MNDFKDHGIAVSHKVNSERLNLGTWVDYGKKIIDNIYPEIIIMIRFLIGPAHIPGVIPWWELRAPEQNR